MTKRASYTPKQRADQYQRQGGRCACGCGHEIAEDNCIGEHEWCVALGNTDKPDGLWHPDCAHVKTYGTAATTYGSDRHEIAKAERLERKRLGTWPETRFPIPKRKDPWPPGKRRMGSRPFQRRAS